ncbi:hypothetical protein [Streptomyces sp. SAS_270]|uniref:hypothetical protein n=1 Tax=Streptomyces sp. SAS_270 TaxID=3412748 RepID=UPI00403D2515
MNLSNDETRLLAEAEAALPVVLSRLYGDRLRSGGVTEEDGRRFFSLSDTEGKRVELRLDTAALPDQDRARTFTNTTTDRYVVQLSDRLPPEQVGRVLSREISELLAVRDRAAVGGPAPLENLLASGATLPDRTRLSDADRGRVGEFNYLATRMNDTALAGGERQEARTEFSALVDSSGLRPRSPIGGEGHTVEQYAADIRRDTALPLLTPDARRAMAELAVPAERLAVPDAQALVEVRARETTQAAAPAADPPFPVPGLRSDGTPVPGPELAAAAATAAEQRTALSTQTLDQLRAEQAMLPEGRHPQREIMIGGGAALAGRDPFVTLVDARGRWHVDPIEAIVQSADQVRHLRESGMGDPYQVAQPQERVPLGALQMWEDTAAARGPLVDGKASLGIGAEGRLIAEISPGDGSPPVKIEVQGSPLVATGIPPEIIPGANRQVPTVPEATAVIAEHLSAAGTPEALATRDRLLALPEGEGRAATTLAALSEPAVAGALGAAADPRLAGATETLRATAAWDEARSAAPGRVLMGDEVGDGDYNPGAANEWLIAGVGGAAIANAEIILQANPDARVLMVGKDAPFVLHNDAQYTALRRAHDAEYGGDGRLVTYSDRRLGEVGTVPGPDGQVRLAALDSGGNPLGIEGDAYVACLGRVSRLPETLESVETWARENGGQVQGELLFDKDRQYLGYRLDFEAGDQKHTVDVTGAASRMLPGNVFSRDDMARLSLLDAKTAPAESGNVAAGFMATALQGSHLAKHRSAEGGPGDGPTPGDGPPAPRGPSGPAASGPTPSEPAASGPAPAGPAPSATAASGPAPSEPAASGPAPAGPAPSATAASGPAASAPAPSEPAASGPAASGPAPSGTAPAGPAASAPSGPAPAGPTAGGPAAGSGSTNNPPAPSAPAPAGPAPSTPAPAPATAKAPSPAGPTPEGPAAGSGNANNPATTSAPTTPAGPAPTGAGSTNNPATPSAPAPAASPPSGPASSGPAPATPATGKAWTTPGPTPEGPAAGSGNAKGPAAASGGANSPAAASDGTNRPAAGTGGTTGPAAGSSSATSPAAVPSGASGPVKSSGAAGATSGSPGAASEGGAAPAANPVAGAARLQSTRRSGAPGGSSAASATGPAAQPPRVPRPQPQAGGGPAR